MPVRAIGQVFDPTVRLLAIAILLASLLPVTGAGRDIAQIVSNAAIFLLFLLNGLRLLRDPIRRNENKSASPDQVVTVDSISAPVQRHAYRRMIPRGSGVGRQRRG